MDLKYDARKLACYVSSLDGFFIPSDSRRPYMHMGATITDTILQAGLNYRNVVAPRVLRLMNEFPEGRTTSGFMELIAFHGMKSLLDWRDPEKPGRITQLTLLLFNEGVETEKMLKDWLECPGNASLLLDLRGIGPKSVDYLRILVGLPDLAVDRHMRMLASRVGLRYTRYEDIKEVVGLASDELGIRRDVFDKAIWTFFSSAESRGQQRSLDDR